MVANQIDFLDELDEALEPVAAPATITVHCTIPGCTETLLFEQRAVWMCNQHIRLALRIREDCAEAQKRVADLDAQRPYKNPAAMKRARLALMIEYRRCYLVGRQIVIARENYVPETRVELPVLAIPDDPDPEWSEEEMAHMSRRQMTKKLATLDSIEAFHARNAWIRTHPGRRAARFQRAIQPILDYLDAAEAAERNGSVPPRYSDRRA